MGQDDARPADAPGGPLPRISVVVPHFEDLHGLGLCLDDLGRQTWPRDEVEVIVADNASPSGAAAVAAVIGGRARLVVVAEKGAGPARNGGAAVARGEILAFTDSDCRPEPGWLAEGVGALSRFDLVGGRMRVLVGDPERMAPAEAFEAVFAFNNEDYVNRQRFTVTANLLCGRAAFERVGGFRAGVSEDFEWCRRAEGLGYRLGYAPAAVVGHPARRTWPRAAEQMAAGQQGDLSPLFDPAGRAPALSGARADDAGVGLRPSAQGPWEQGPLQGRTEDRRHRSPVQAAILAADGFGEAGVRTGPGMSPGAVAQAQGFRYSAGLKGRSGAAAWAG